MQCTSSSAASPPNTRQRNGDTVSGASAASCLATDVVRNITSISLSRNDFASAGACDTDAHAAWCRELLSRGVYPPPSQFEAWFPSLAHTAEQIERTVAAAAAAFACLPTAGGAA